MGIYIDSTVGACSALGAGRVRIGSVIEVICSNTGSGTTGIGSETTVSVVSTAVGSC